MEDRKLKHNEKKKRKRKPVEAMQKFLLQDFSLDYSPDSSLKSTQVALNISSSCP